MFPKANQQFFVDYFKTLNKEVVAVDLSLLEKSAKLITDAHSKGGKTIFAGNGGSAAMASHLSVDLTRSGCIRAINFNEANLLTCLSNDYGYEHWVAHALEAYADINDLIILISSSGKSSNIINGAVQARKMGLPVITLSGFKSDNPLRELGDVNFWCDSEAYNIVELTHHTWLLAIVDYIIQDKFA